MLWCENSSETPLDPAGVHPLLSCSVRKCSWRIKGQWADWFISVLCFHRIASLWDLLASESKLGSCLSILSQASRLTELSLWPNYQYPGTVVTWWHWKLPNGDLRAFAQQGSQDYKNPSHDHHSLLSLWRSRTMVSILRAKECLHCPRFWPKSQCRTPIGFLGFW